MGLGPILIPTMRDSLKRAVRLARYGAWALRPESGNAPHIWDLNIVAINRCNQACPMCNAGILAQESASIMTAAKLTEYLRAFDGIHIPVATISGGEPTLAPELPEIIGIATQRFPEKVMLISNFFTKGPLFERSMRAALASGVHIVCSFDGFGTTADNLRGAKSVSDVTVRNMQLVNTWRTEMASQSILEVHTVISDANLESVEDILGLSRELKWTQTVAPVNAPAQVPRHPQGVGLERSQRLNDVLRVVKSQSHVTQMRAYIDGIPAYAEGVHAKRCPYLISQTKNLKVFLEPDGNLTLCDRIPLGNVTSTSLGDILSGSERSAFQRRAEQCEGCWLSCFTEPALMTDPRLALDAARHRIFPKGP